MLKAILVLVILTFVAQARAQLPKGICETIIIRPSEEYRHDFNSPIAYIPEGSVIRFTDRTRKTERTGTFAQARGPMGYPKQTVVHFTDFEGNSEELSYDYLENLELINVPGHSPLAEPIRFAGDLRTFLPFCPENTKIVYYDVRTATTQTVLIAPAAGPGGVLKNHVVRVMDLTGREVAERGVENFDSPVLLEVPFALKNKSAK